MDKIKWKGLIMKRMALRNVNLTEFKLIDASCAVLSFINSYDGKPCGNIKCHNTWKVQYDTDSLLEFPVFICDVALKEIKAAEVSSVFNSLQFKFNIPDVTSCQLLCVDSGEVSMMVLCEKLEVNITNG